MALNQWTLNPINFNIKSLDNHGEEENNENELVCLRIARFSKVPKIDFQKVKINKSKTIKFEVFNPNSYSTLIHFQNFNSNDFSLNIPANMQNTPPPQSDTNDCISLNLDPDQVRQVSVTWSPTTPGNTREVLTVKWDGGLKLQVIFLGNCIGETMKKSNLKSTKKVYLYHICICVIYELSIQQCFFFIFYRPLVIFINSKISKNSQSKHALPLPLSNIFQAKFHIHFCFYHPWLSFLAQG